MSEREVIEADFLVVGGGAAGLCAAYEFATQAQSLGISEPMIVVLEKGAEIGAHSVSGAVMNPVTVRKMFPNCKDQGFPIKAVCDFDEVRVLTEKMSVPLPITPPPFQNHGNWIVSLSEVNRWLAARCEEVGVNIFPGFAATEVLMEGDQVIGVRTGDKGLDKNGQRKSNFEPGIEIHSKVTLFSDGTRSPLFKRVAKKLGAREGKQIEVFEEGVKEVIQMPEGTVTPGRVYHTAGFPLQESMGGGFIYTSTNDQIFIGLVAFLDSRDPLLNPHRDLQRLKAHPWVADLIQGGQVIAYGGKTIPAGGWYSMPELSGRGWMVAGDSASMVDVQKLKGIHLAMWAGMEAGFTAAKAVKSESFKKPDGLAEYKERIQKSLVKKELYRVRNFHQTLSKGFLSSLPLIAIQEVTGGRGLVDPMHFEEDAKTTEPVVDVWGMDRSEIKALKAPDLDGKVFFDKLSSVYMTGTHHDEDSPNHLKLVDGSVCRDVCADKYNSPCNHFCPAQVYEMVPARDAKLAEQGKFDLQINSSNCIHCQTCDIKCPFNNIDWTLPEGGGGPQYSMV